MPIQHSLLAAGTILGAATVAATAEPERHLAEPPIEEKIEHLENAAKHLAEAGMKDESTRLRVQAAAMRRDMHRGEFADLEAMIEALRQENRMLKVRIMELEAEFQARTAEPAAAPIDKVAAEVHRKQTEATWAAIKRAARGPRPLPDAPEDQPVPLEAPQLPPTLTEPFQEPGIHPDEHALLNNILQTLQRIELNMKE